MLVVLTLCYYVCAKENWWLGLILVVLCLEICDNVCGGVVAVTSVLFCPI